MKKINPKWIDLYRTEREMLSSVRATLGCFKKLHLRRAPSGKEPFMGELSNVIKDIENSAAYFDLTLELTMADLIGGDVFDVRSLLDADGADRVD